MANIRVSASKKATVIILLLLFFVVGGTGGYLLWRVNQEKELSPGESEAGSNQCNCYKPGESCGSLPDCNNVSYPISCYCVYVQATCPLLPLCTPGEVPQCTQGSHCTKKVHCIWPEVAYCQSGTCICKSPPNGCYDQDPQCTPQCPAGYEKCSGADCTGDIKDVECSHDCASCNNRYYVRAKCKKIVTNTCGDGNKGGSEACDPPGSVCTAASGKQSTCSSTCTCPEPANICGDGNKAGDEACDPPGSTCTTASGKEGTCSSTCTCPEPPVGNTCDAQGAKWVTQPPSSVEFGKAIPFEYITGDTDGVQNVNIIVKLDGTSVPVTKIPATDNAPNITVKGTLNGSEGVLSPGNHKLEISWNDIKGAGGVPCYAYSMITVLPENPEWDIEKKALQTCVNDWTENPTSNLTYTITITNTNTGSGAGTITSILDTLDPKVDSTKVTNISNGGVISNGKIVWNLTSPLSDFDPGESKSFTYSISVNKESFGIYENTVVATPDISSGDSSNLEASVNIEARCNVPGEPVQPDTGLFDDSKNIVILGAALLFAGLGWSWITDSFGTMKQKISYESKARFEKRVSKR